MKRRVPSASLLLLMIVFSVLVLKMDQTGDLFAWLLPESSPSVYDRTTFLKMTFEHIYLVAISSCLAIAVGVISGILVTRKSGREFLPVVNSLSSLGQTFPPVAVLALAVPAVGFGAEPTIIALFIYGLLPIIRNTIAGMESVPPSTLEAARGMGMSRFQVLWQVEIPLSLSVIFAGIRTSTIINIGTATLGATIGAGGLGAPIIAGLITDNQAFVLQGTLLVGMFAVMVDLSLEWLEGNVKVPVAAEVL